MPPQIALFLWFFLLVALLLFDPAREPESSTALWIPVFWIFFVASRLPSQWLGNSANISAQALEDGNPLDRAALSFLILLALVTLISRSFSWSGFFSKNLCLMVFLLFALVSFTWSDYPLIALKRWLRDLGNYFVILVVLSDPRPFEAVRGVLRRFCFIFIPLSVVLVKYFPALSRYYGTWSGVPEYIGAATSKNMLGNVCMISGIYFLWDTVTRWAGRKEPRQKWAIRLNLFFLLMTLWLLNLSQSATSKVCLVLGCLVILAVYSGWGHRHLTLIRALVPATFCLYVLLAYGLDLNGAMVSRLGRDPTLTDRTLIWKAVWNQHTNPVLGTGYESFWLGPRLRSVWQSVPGINETHNGYLDIYANLGIIGCLLLLAFLVASYQTIGARFSTSFPLAALGIAIWAVSLFYNVTEAAFSGGIVWLTLLLCGLALPERQTEQLERPVRTIVPAKRHSNASLSTISQQR
jgi:exopolysaccharide production protein ExoQ